MASALDTLIARNLNARAPRTTDDINTVGAVGGDLWNCPDQNIAYTCFDNAPGSAIWVPANTGGYPIDAVGGPCPPGIFGTKRLSSRYIGPLVKVINPITGVATDIASIAGGDIDRASLFGAMGTAKYLLVATLYNQTGSGFNATQTAQANMPVMLPAATLGNSIPIVFDSVIQGTPVNKWLEISPRLTIAAGNFHAMFFVGSARCAAQSCYFGSMTRSDGTHWDLGSNGAIFSTNSAFVTGIKSGCSANLENFVVPQTPFVGGAVTQKGVGQAGTYIFADNLVSKSNTNAYDDLSAAGGYIGRCPSITNNGSGYSEISAFVIYDRAAAITATDVTQFYHAASRHFGLTPQIKRSLVCSGDSITDGYGSSHGQNWVKQMIPLLNTPYRVTNIGAFGSKTSDQLIQFKSGLASLYPNHELPNVLVQYGGTNDISQGCLAAEIHANLTAFVTAAQAIGVKVCLVTIPPQAAFTAAQLAVQSALNALIRENTAGANAIADVANHPLLGNQANCSDTAYYVDGTHPTTLGYSILAMIIAEAVNTILS